MSYVKPSLIAAIALIAGILFLQNTQSVDTRILFFTITAPRAILLASTFLLGLGAGALITLHFNSKYRKKTNSVSE